MRLLSRPFALAACLLLAAPALIVGIMGMVGGDPAVGVAALAVGVLGGAVVTVAGVLIGGRTLERTAPDLLQRIKAFPVG